MINADQKLKVSARAITKEFKLNSGMPIKFDQENQEPNRDTRNFFDRLTHEYELDQIAARGTVAEYSDSFWALQGVSFDVYDGDIVGVVGTNGSGKSTLLNIISGIIPQTSGELLINGSISVVAIGEGLNNQLTGRENIQIKQLMMGKTQAEIDKNMTDIIEFSELGEFIDQPIKTYSSGMRSKLGFSIAVHDDSDIMIIDEALSVGDATFSAKALKKIEEFMHSGRTIFFVSHSLAQVRQFTNKTMWIQYGKLQSFGTTEEITNQYQKFSDEFKVMSNDEQKKFREDNRLKQRLFTLDQLSDQLTKEGVDEKEKNNYLKLRSFSGLPKNFFYPSLMITIFLWLYFAWRIIRG